MLNFTTQQLMGGQRYTAGVKIGNWDEDVSRSEVAARDYEARRAKGELLHLRKARERAFLTQRVPHSYSADGTIRFGDTVQLALGEGRDARVLADHLFSLLSPGHVRVTATRVTEAQARNTFVVARVGRRRGEKTGWRRAPGLPEDDVLRYGDRVYLTCNPSLVVDPDTHVAGLPYFLHSARANNLLGTARKGKQEVSLTTRCDADAEWCVAAASGDRLLSDGQPVRAGEPVVLQHVMSAVALAAVPGDSYPMDLGDPAELDVHCANHRGTGHVGMRHSGELPISAAQPPNIWRFVLASDPAAAVDRRGFARLTPEALLERARSAIAAACGPHGVRSLALAFDALDPRGSGFLPAAATQWALFDHGAHLQEGEFSLLLEPFAASMPGVGGSTVAATGGFLDRARLLAALRGAGELSGAASGAVEEAYAHLETRCGAPVTIGALKKAFDGKWDPRVQAGRLTKEEAKTEFARQWPSHPRPGDVVTVSQLAQYYLDVAGALGGDDWALCELIANSWHVPGKGSWKVPRSAKVLVTFFKGSSTEAVIPQGELIDPSDQGALAAALEKAGYGGIARVKVLALLNDEDD